MSTFESQAKPATAPLTLKQGTSSLTAQENLSGDLLRGADQIAWFLFGDSRQRRRVYHLVQQSRLPVFRMGVTLCARKSRLVAWIEQEELKATGART